MLMVPPRVAAAACALNFAMWRCIRVYPAGKALKDNINTLLCTAMYCRTLHMCFRTMCVSCRQGAEGQHYHPGSARAADE
jgi:hypothetical protein